MAIKMNRWDAKSHADRILGRDVFVTIRRKNIIKRFEISVSTPSGSLLMANGTSWEDCVAQLRTSASTTGPG
jgi:hypothetical protein